MSDYVREHLLEIILILAVFILLLREIRKKSLTYTILTNSAVLPVPNPGRIELLYEGQTIPNLRLVEIRIKNSGGVPIEPSDYLERLSVRLPKGNILSSEVKAAGSLEAHIETDPSNRAEIVLGKTFLNPKEFFDIKLLLAGEAADLSLTGRVKGIAEIKKLTGRESSYYILLSLVAVNLMALIARFLGLLDRSFLILLQILTLLFGLWMTLDPGTEPQDTKEPGP